MSTTVKYIHSGTVPMNALEMTQNFWNDNVGPMSLKLTKEAHMLDKYRKKLPTVKEANKKDLRIPSSFALATQSPPAS